MDRRCWLFGALFTPFCLLARPMAEAQNVSGPARLEVRNGVIEIDAGVPPGVREVELQIESGRNRPVVKHTDRSPWAPAEWKDKPPNLPQDRQVWYPVVDIVPTERIEGVAVFAPWEGSCRLRLNSMFYNDDIPLELVNVLPGQRLEPWENVLYTEGGRPLLERFYLRERVPVQEGRVRVQLQAASPRWFGTVRLRDATAGADAEDLTVLTLPPVTRQVPAADDLPWGPASVRKHHLPAVSSEPPSR
jgi:hypothetical protein